MMRALLLALLASALCTACDSTVPPGEEQLVVEAFLEATPNRSRVVLRRSAGPEAPYLLEGQQVNDATVRVHTEDGFIPLEPVGNGTYEPVGSDHFRERLRFVVGAEWAGQRATAVGQIPPRIKITDIVVDVPEAPVEAIFLDGFDLDSLGVTIDEGFVYPIEVTLWWERPADMIPADSSYWIQTRLAPVVPFSSTVLDFFLLAEAVFQESTAWHDDVQQYRWTGVYAIPVEQATDPLPRHELELGLLRSTEAYAQFARTRADRDRREPLSNVTGGLGIVAGIALDSMRVEVPLAQGSLGK
ncbi:MAG: hypothetical protein RhofKO_37530 [Rhodothermales bacterium]